MYIIYFELFAFPQVVIYTNPRFDFFSRWQIGNLLRGLDVSYSSIIIHQFGARKFTQILFRLETDTNYLGFALYQSSILLLEFGAMLSNDLRKETFPGVIIIFVY